MSGSTTGTVRIIEYAPRHRDHFRALNLAWITEHFEIEEPDRWQLDHPESHILGQGGHIFIAESDDEVGWNLCAAPRAGWFVLAREDGRCPTRPRARDRPLARRGGDSEGEGARRASSRAAVEHRARAGDSTLPLARIRRGPTAAHRPSPREHQDGAGARSSGDAVDLAQARGARSAGRLAA